MTIIQHKASENLEAKPSNILSDTPKPIIPNPQPMDKEKIKVEYRNGNLVCSAHPLLVDDIKDIQEKLESIEEYFILRKKIFKLIYDNSFIAGLLSGIILLLIAYFTVL